MHIKLLGGLEKFAKTGHVNTWDAYCKETGSEFEFKSSSVVKVGFLRVAFFLTYILFKQ